MDKLQRGIVRAFRAGLPVSEEPFQAIADEAGLSVVELLAQLEAWKPEPAWTLGGIIATVMFMYGTGAISDWLKLANGDDIPEHPEAPRYQGLAKYFSISFDHKVIGVQYGYTSLFLFLTDKTLEWVLYDLILGWKR